MLFNSIDFAIFLPIVFTLYWLLNKGSLRLQNFFIVCASYLFYGWWDWRFLSLVLFSTVTDFLLGIGFGKLRNQANRKILLWISIIVNLGFLGFFKYYNFFIENFVAAFSFFGKEIHPHTLHIILPVGISFYTFQTLSYTIDVYKRKLEPTKDIIAFAAFVSFFPQLVAGPIERATHLLPQFYYKRTFSFDQATDGLKQMLWGFVKKIVIADNCAEYANQIFNNSDNYSGITLFFGALLFTFQIYGDFSGYSDIAIGTSRLFGFNLMKNFAFPYFSRDIAEFWRRWHISLSSWFRDYVYIPLGGSKCSTSKKIRNTFIIFLLSGLWHGANWTFIAWGAANALLFLPLLLSRKNRKNLDVVAKGKVFPSISELTQITTTFLLTCLCWIFFRATNIHQAFLYIKDMFSGLFQKSEWIRFSEFLSDKRFLLLFVLIPAFIIFEWMGREHEYGIEKLCTRWKRGFRWSFYYLLIFIIFFFAGDQQEFIYFQF